MMFTFRKKRASTTAALQYAGEQKLPYQPMRLSFRAMREYDDYRKQFPQVFAQVWKWQMDFGDRAEPFTFPGICEACDRVINFAAEPASIDHAVFSHQVNWWLGSRCERCRLVMRDRVLARFVMEHAAPGAAVYHVGHHSRLRKWLSDRYPGAECSQFSQGKAVGTVVDGLRYDDLTTPPRNDASFDIVGVADVLDHVPDHVAALSVIARMLRPGGKALFSLPWVGNEQYEHVERALNGPAPHILPTAHHVDPDTGEKFPRYRAFGWKILDELRSAGFADATAQFIFAPVHGYLMLRPIVSATR